VTPAERAGNKRRRATEPAGQAVPEPARPAPPETAAGEAENDEVLEVAWHAEDDIEPSTPAGTSPQEDDEAPDADDAADPVVTDATAPAPGSAPGTGGATSNEGSRWSARDRTRERELLALIASLPEGHPDRIAARDEVVTMHLPLAVFLARRFRDRGESMDDLTQVATIGLLKAVDRFQPDRGVEFSTFATPTMVGEIKRHFRDRGWAIRVPRRLQELRISISRATAELSQSTGRSPTVADLAAHLKVTEEDILEGMESAHAYATLSLDATTADGTEDGSSLADTLGQEDASLSHVETRETVNPLLASLPPRERRIIHMRFYENKTQSQIAEEVGVSQMHVSRLLAKSLAQMRTNLAADRV